LLVELPVVLLVGIVVAVSHKVRIRLGHPRHVCPVRAGPSRVVRCGEGRHGAVVALFCCYCCPAATLNAATFEAAFRLATLCTDGYRVSSEIHVFAGLKLAFRCE
jgi:hypothetical protein